MYRPEQQRHLRYRSSRGRIEQQIDDIVRRRGPDEKFRRKVIHALGIFARVSGFGEHPTLRKYIPDRAGNRSEALAWPSSSRGHNIVEKQVAFIKRVLGAGEPDRTTAVLLQQI
jgi:hypothetical protein